MQTRSFKGRQFTAEVILTLPPDSGSGGKLMTDLEEDDDEQDEAPVYGGVQDRGGGAAFDARRDGDKSGEGAGDFGGAAENLAA
jgi:hypothetical protein